jgi:Tol biopolymer transport system component
MLKYTLPLLVCTAAIAAQGTSQQAKPPATESHLANVKQLTFGGENAEAYFSPDGRQLVFQSTRPGSPCDQIFTMSADGGTPTRVSTGRGRTTCGYFNPDGQTVIYASTHLAGAECPPKPSYERGYVWPIYPAYEIFRRTADGTLTQLTKANGYDAEGTVGRDGSIVFTSMRDGDMEIYSMKPDGTGVQRLTNRPGPDGGPFYSPDGSKIIFRGRPIAPGPELDDYRALLTDALWRPTKLEIYVMDRDGKNLRAVTSLGVASFAPAWHPDGQRIIFASNVHDPKGRDFDLYLIRLDGTGLQRVTYNDTFDGFPMFSPDGRRLVWASNRKQSNPGDTNIFVADWRD